MNLQNGYKVLYEKVADGKRTFFASKTGIFADAEQISDEFEIGKYKLIYERDGRVYASESGVPAEDDVCMEAFDKVVLDESVAMPDEEVEVENTVLPETPAEDEEVLDTPDKDVVIDGVTGDPAIEEELPE